MDYFPKSVHSMLVGLIAKAPQSMAKNEAYLLPKVSEQLITELSQTGVSEKNWDAIEGESIMERIVPSTDYRFYSHTLKISCCGVPLVLTVEVSIGMEFSINAVFFVFVTVQEDSPLAKASACAEEMLQRFETWSPDLLASKLSEKTALKLTL